jgi:rubrerythrin
MSVMIASYFINFEKTDLMKAEYNSRQRKIYKDYNSYSNDSLFEMVKESDKYLDEVIEIINDILVERKAIFPHEEQAASSDYIDRIIPAESEKKSELFGNKVIRDNEELVKSFVSKLREKPDTELSDIITKYIEYKSETVKAALILAVDRGIISFDLKLSLSEQIDANFAAHEKGIRRFGWEKNNAFIKYVSAYQDEEIYALIDDPKGIVLDVYHAILFTAKERELISGEDFADFYKDAKLAIRTEREIKMAEFNEYLKSDYSEHDIEEGVDLEAEKEKFWKCPVCNQIVEMDLTVCWNCQSETPQTIVHPDREEIIKEIASKKSISPAKAGLSVIAGGVLIGVGGQLRHHHSLFFDSDVDYISLIFGGLVAVVGIGIMIYGIFESPKD